MDTEQDALYEAAAALLDRGRTHTDGKSLRYIAVSIVLDGYSIDFRVAPHTPETVLNETHDEAVAREVIKSFNRSVSTRQ